MKTLAIASRTRADGPPQTPPRSVATARNGKNVMYGTPSTYGRSKCEGRPLPRSRFGIEMARGLHHALRLAGQLSTGEAPEAPPLARLVVKGLADQIGTIQLQLARLEKKLLAWHRSNEL